MARVAGQEMEQGDMLNSGKVQQESSIAVIPSSSTVPGTRVDTTPPSVSTFMSGAGLLLRLRSPPDTGVRSVRGRRREMEDAVAVKHSFLSVPCLNCNSLSAAAADQGLSLERSEDNHKCNQLSSTLSPLHFFGVYDGHGGVQAANHCRRRLHHALVEELLNTVMASCHNGIVAHGMSLHYRPRDDAEQNHRVISVPLSSEVESAATAANVAEYNVIQSQKCGPRNLSVHNSIAAETWEKAMAASFLRMDRELLMRPSSPVIDQINYSSLRMSSTADQAGMDPTVEEGPPSDTVGSTAVVAVLSCCDIIVANCGDSRAVLSRNGRAIPLSTDHKPDRVDEMARIEAAGGRVIYWDGYRVLGVLAMSRAIGDHFLKPYVIAEPEMTFTPRSGEDECLILASDGLWDVVSNEDACSIARKCLNAAQSSGSMAMTGAQLAASVLVTAAHERGSGDNISVIVVDLRT